MASKKKNPLVGLCVLPTASKYNLTEPAKSNAYVEGQQMYVLQFSSENPEDLKGGPEFVVLTSMEPLINPETDQEFTVGDDIATKHTNRKNLPPRRIVSIFDGTDWFGEKPEANTTLPHWEFIEGEYSANTEQQILDRVKETRVAREAAKVSKKDSKEAKAA